jgi:hypothetical protein
MITPTDEEWAAIQQQIADLTQQVAVAQQRIAELVAKKTPPPFVKAKWPERATKARKKRAPEHNHARQREEATRVVLHPIERCPGCQGRLSSTRVSFAARQQRPGSEGLDERVQAFFQLLPTGLKVIRCMFLGKHIFIKHKKKHVIGGKKEGIIEYAKYCKG